MAGILYKWIYYIITNYIVENVDILYMKQLMLRFSNKLRMDTKLIFNICLVQMFLKRTDSSVQFCLLCTLCITLARVLLVLIHMINEYGKFMRSRR